MDRLEHPIEFLESMLENFKMPQFEQAWSLTNDLIDIVKKYDVGGFEAWIQSIDFDPEYLGTAFCVVYQFAEDYLKKYLNELPLADSDREETAARIFSEYKTMSPEEWAARYSHTVGCSSFDTYRYKNNELQTWIYRLHSLMRNPIEINKNRELYLSEKEIEAIETELDDPLTGL